jgi:hypothetical protein
LHTIAKIGATGFGNSVSSSLPDRDRVEGPEPGATGFEDPVPSFSADRADAEQIIEAFNDPNSPPLSLITNKGPGGSQTVAHGSSSSSS